MTTDFAEAALSLRIVPITGDVSHGRELPYIGALPAVHFEGAGRGSEPDDEGINILPDELIAEPSGNLLPRCGATRKRDA